MSSHHHVVWKDISTDNTYTFEDPITGAHVWIQEYTEIYGPFLETLDGRNVKSFIDKFFTISPIMSFHWEFVDANAKAKFYDRCQKMDLIPELRAIHEGTWGDEEKVKNKPKARIGFSIAVPKPKRLSSTYIKEKRDRIEIFRQQMEQETPKPKKKEINQKDKEAKIQASRLASVEKLTGQIEKETDALKQAKLKQKLVKIKRQIAESKKKIKVDDPRDEK